MIHYPRITALGLTVHPEPVAHVKNDELRAMLSDRCVKCVKPGEQHHNGPCRSRWPEFVRIFGVQTMLLEGPYASDVEAVLELMATNRLTGGRP